MKISPYQQSIVNFNYTPFTYNTELASTVLLHKQQQFNQTYEGIQKLRKEALNINFINKGEQAKIDKFNQDVNNFFNGFEGELGDLSKGSVAKRYTDLFNVIGQDANLVSRYKKDQKYQQELQNVYKKRDSKDPVKQGYHPINHSNYEARLQEYANANLNEEDIDVLPYNNFIDVNKELTALIKNSVPIEEFTRQEVKNGYLHTVKYKGRDPQKVKNITDNYLSGKGASQMREEAEYYHRVNNDGLYKQNLYNEYMNSVNTQYEQLNNYKKDLVKRSVSNPDDKELINTIEQITTRIGNLDVERDTTFDDFSRKSDKDLINYAASLHVSDTSNKFSNSMGGYATSEKIEMDRTYFEGLKLAETIKNNTAKRTLLAAKTQSELAKNTSSSAGVVNGQIQPDRILKTTTAQVDLRPMAESLLESSKYTIFNSQNIFKTGLSGLTQSNLSQEEREYFNNPPRVPDGIIDEFVTYGEFDFNKDADIKSRVPQSLSGEDIAKKIITNQSEVLKNPFFSKNPYVVGFINAATKLGRDATEDDIPTLMKMAEEQVNTPGTNAYAANLRNENNKKILTRFMGKANIDLSDGLSEEESKRYDEFINKHADIIRYTNVGISNLDSTLESKNGKQAIINKTNKLITDMIDIEATPSNVAVEDNSVVISPRFLEHNNFTQLEVSNNGMLKVSFNGKLMEKINKGKSSDDKYENAVFYTKNKNGEPVKHVVNNSNNTIEFYHPSYDKQNYFNLLPVILDHEWLPYSVNKQVFKLRKGVNENGETIEISLPDGSIKSVPSNSIDPQVLVNNLTKLLMNG